LFNRLSHSTVLLYVIQVIRDVLILRVPQPLGSRGIVGIR
jgi:hypothetical protein